MAKLKNNTPLHSAISKGLEDSGMDDSKNEVNVFISQPKAKFEDKYAFLFIGAQNKVIRSLSPSASKMFLWFCCEMQYGNFVEIRQKELSILLSLSLRTTKTCLKELIACEVIIPYKNENDTRQNFYQINPFHSWRGNAKERIKAIKHLEINDQLRLEFE
jgi:hypothetical protein